MEATQECRVYVNNLPYSMKEEQLKEFAAQVEAAEPSKVLILTTHRGLSRGCAVLQFGSAEEAQDAISKLNEQTYDGRVVFAREDRESSLPGTNVAAVAGVTGSAGSNAANATGVGARRERRSPGAQPETTVFFGNLPFSMAWQDLKDFARAAGPVVRADIALNPQRRSRGFGTVVFETREAAEKAVAELNGQEVDGRTIGVHFDRRASERFDRQAPKSAVSQSSFEFTAASGHGPVSEFVHVSNLPWQTTDHDLVELFETIDRVVRAETQRLPDGRMLGCGVVQFAEPVAAELAVRSFNGYLYGGLNLVVSYARYPPPL